MLEISSAVPAEYPAEALARKIQGTVSVSVVISPTGDVKSAEATGADPLLQTAAIAAAKQYKFKARKGAEYLPLKCWANLIFDFQISDNAMPSASSNSVPPVMGRLIHGEEFPNSVRVSATVTNGMAVKRVSPIYPIQARNVQGTVVLAMTISADGKVKDIRPISGPKELQGPAEHAMSQWEYKPYLFMGEPVDVSTEITMKFDVNTKPPSPVLLEWLLAHPKTGTASELPVHQNSPLYPEEAKQKGKRAIVVVAATASQDGVLQNLQVVEGNRLFNDAALEAVKEDKDLFVSAMDGTSNLHKTVIVEFVP